MPGWEVSNTWLKMPTKQRAFFFDGMLQLDRDEKTIVQSKSNGNDGEEADNESQHNHSNSKRCNALTGLDDVCQRHFEEQ